jgi:hypothetical protein
MMHKTFKILATTAVLLSVAGCDTGSALNLAPGKYEKSTSTVTPNGTAVTQDNQTTVGYDSYGNKKAVVQTKTTQDPPGLFNKTTTGTTVIEER